MTKRALITGVTGQDGAYLSEFLLSKGYEVHGLKRRSSMLNTERVDHLYEDKHQDGVKFKLHFGDLADSLNIIRLVQEIQPDEIYNLGAMSHVRVSFDMPEYTGDVDGLGTLRILEAIRSLGLEKKTKFYQASTSELYGLVQEVPQRETTPFYPRSPYAVAKLYAYWITVNYREAYNIFASNGILFNHESPLRGETFVTRKITRAACRIALGLQDTVYMGNLDAKRDWGHARDYVKAMWLMMQHHKADDFVIATGITTTVRDFAVKTFSKVGIELAFRGSGIDEVGVVAEVTSPEVKVKQGDVVLKIDSNYFRPTEVELLIGDPQKAKRELNWELDFSLDTLIDDMVESDMRLFKRENYLKQGGHKISGRDE
jgi:GDPmannose 4,6-dehydratase